MKSITKSLLIGAIIVSTGAAGISHSKFLKNENENYKLVEKLNEASLSYEKLQKQNKKLSKRVIEEINRIIVLSDSIKTLDKDLKKGKLELQNKIFITKQLSYQNQTLTSRQKKINNKLENKITKVKNGILTAKTDVLKIKESITTPIFISDIETTPMKRKTRGGFTRTENHKKIDGLRTNFQILNNNFPNDLGKRKVYLNLYNLKDGSLSYSNEIYVNFDKKFLSVSTIIEVERKKFKSGDYELAISIDNKKIKSSNLIIASR